MTHTEPEILALHRALCEALELPALRPGLSQQSQWSHFLRELEPLQDMPEGKLSVDDIRAVIAEMQRHNRRRPDAQYRLTLWAILTNPERFFDLAVEIRQRPRRKPVAKPQPTLQPKPEPNGLIFGGEFKNFRDRFLRKDQQQ